MNRIVLVVLSLLLLSGLPYVATAAGPAPYSEPAAARITKSLDKLGTYIPPVGETKEENVRAIIGYWERVYALAGFSFEKSIVQYSNDLNKDKDFASKGAYARTPAFYADFLSLQLNEMRMDGELKKYVDRTLSRDTVRALDNILAIGRQKAAVRKAEQERKASQEKAEQERVQRENDARELAKVEAAREEDRLQFQREKDELATNEKVRAAEIERKKEKNAQARELASLRKQDTLKTLGGRYENQQGKDRKPIGYVDIKVISDDRASFTLYNKVNERSCRIDNQEASIEYGDDNRVNLMFGNDTGMSGDACRVTMKFREYSKRAKEKMGSDYYVEVDRNGCKAYCERGGYLEGKYVKVY